MGVLVNYVQVLCINIVSFLGPCHRCVCDLPLWVLTRVEEFISMPILRKKSILLNQTISLIWEAGIKCR